MTEWKLAPEDIEARSFAIIDAEAPAHSWAPDAWTVVRRMVHTSADFEYVGGTVITENALAAGMEALSRGAVVVTDTRMAEAGISKARLGRLGAATLCFVDRPETAALARETGLTRSAAAVDLALAEAPDGVFVVGNAPTALFRLLERIAEGKARPALVVGLPVGFVNAAESKAALREAAVPHITNIGRKGGSNVAASVINALAELALRAKA